MIFYGRGNFSWGKCLGNVWGCPEWVSISPCKNTPKTLLVLDFALQHVVISKFHAARRTFGSRAFAVAGPMFWNRLPPEIRANDSLQSFKSQLKTYYFSL